MSPQGRTSAQDKAIRLFAYLRELAQLRAPQTRDIETYETVLWFSEIPREEGCYSVSWGAPLEEIDVWVEIKKRREPPCPSPPVECSEWVDPAELRQSDSEPRLKELIRLGSEIPAEPPVDGTTPIESISLNEKPEVLISWERYLEGKWRPWAEKHRRWKSVRSIYSRLFTIFQLQRSLAESYEFMLGLGLLCWITPTGQRVRRHILAGQANLEFDANTGTLSVRPAADGVKLGFEMDMLEPDERPEVSQQLALEQALEQTAETPWDSAAIEPIVRGWVNSLDPDGIYEATEEKPESLDRRPRVAPAPAVFLRRRTAKSLVHAYKTVIEQIKNAEELPFGVRRLLETDNNELEHGLSGKEAQRPGEVEEAEPIHFPLPANDEQRDIAEQMSHRQGVLVQGPPGTGKSHTIANLICHLLATGKRILVTSQTPRALRVLRDKIPMDLLPLCVSVLGNDRKSLTALEDSVHGITNRLQRWNPRRNDEEIHKLSSEIYELKKGRAFIDSRLREQREKDTYTFSVADGAYRGTAETIAKRICEDSHSHDWLSDQLSPDFTPPLTRGEMRRLLEAYRVLNPSRISELNQRFPTLEEMPSIADVVSLVEREKQAATQCQQHEPAKESSWHAPVSRATAESRQLAVKCLQELLAAVGTVTKRPVGWVPPAAHSFLADQDRPLRQLHEITYKHLRGLAERARSAQSVSVEVPPNTDRRKLRADATDLCGHLRAGGRLGWGPFRKEVVKRARYITTDVKVNGRACKSLEVLQQLLQRLEVEATVSLLWDAWQGMAERVAGPLPRQVSELEEAQEALESILALESKLVEAKKAVASLGDVSEPKWHDSASTSELVAVLEATLAEEELHQCRRDIEKHCAVLTSLTAHPEAHPVVSQALEALRLRDLNGWGNSVHEIEQLTRDRQLRQWQHCAEAKLAEVAPQLALSLRDTATEPVWDERLARIEDTWQWARADSWLHQYEKEHDIRALESERQQVENKLSAQTALLAAAKAWRHCFARMTEENRRYLEAWAKEIKQIGKGKGRYAERHRRTAQKYMNRCREAIPAWVMPFYRIPETVEPKNQCFDVAIVDEASQSGPEALLLLYLAKQVVIVGDDQQISPEDIGIDQAQVHSLQERYLHDFGLKETFGPGYSLFAQGEILYGNRIALREHFRCMPEIIRFSNDLCYSRSPLLPLRQYPPRRLEPIVVRHIPNGFREGGAQSARNQPEADCLVEAVCQCCENPAYDKKSMGVISLQGDYQAGLVQRLLKDRLGEQEMIRRQIVCGDAYAFQGDERDVIFMSMVAAPNERIGPLTKETDKRRFNVAASRARDQVWLFHTATLNELNQQDMRFYLLSYYQNPGQSPVGAPDWDRCESPLERDVGQQIHARGYRLVVQYEPFGRGGKRVDFVVEGEKTRLAIECDGDRWHGPEQYDKDMFRQRQLERAGLVFWRIRGSEFRRDPQKALQPLWNLLREMGIEPWDDSKKEPVTPALTSPEYKEMARPSQPVLIDKAARDNLFMETSQGSMNIRAFPREQVKTALHSCVPITGAVAREDLLHAVAQELGYTRLGRNIRTAINRAIGAEVRAGRLGTDWERVWKP